MAHLYSLFWKIDKWITPCNHRYKNIYRDGKPEGEQLQWHSNGQLFSKHFYKDGKEEGEQSRWYSTGHIEYCHFK